MSNFPKDRFDDLPAGLDRRGAHRAPRTRASRIASWLWGLGAVAALVLIGIIGMSIIDGIVLGGGSAPQASPTEQAPAQEQPTQPPAPQASLDPSIAVTVLNGTGGSGVASNARDTLRAAGWNVANVGEADSFDHPTTLIAYADAKDEGAALKIAQDLGGGEPKLDPAAAQPGAIVVTVGRDIAG